VEILYESQLRAASNPSIDACRALDMVGANVECINDAQWLSKLQSGAE